MGAIESQAVLTPLTEAAIFLVATVSPGARIRSRDLLADVRPASVGRVPHPRGRADLRGRHRLRRRGTGCSAARVPPSCTRSRSSRAPCTRAVATPGDLLFHIRAERMDLCFELAQQLIDRLGDAVAVVDEVHGFRYFDERDLLGFVDGTENPAGGRRAPASSATRTRRSPAAAT